MRYVYISLIVLVSVIVLVFTLQNLPTVTVHFVTLQLTLPLSRSGHPGLLPGHAHGRRFCIPDHILVPWLNHRDHPPTS
jgi:hypothetical protein